jgi:hypothetical protein
LADVALILSSPDLVNFLNLDGLKKIAFATFQIAREVIIR